MGCNHQGDFKLAKKMINDAAALNVWGVKFQKRNIEDIHESIKNKPRSLINSFGPTYYEHRKALEFTTEQIHELKVYSESLGLEFLCSAFDEKSVINLLNMDCNYIKLPSQLYSDVSLQNLLLSRRQVKAFKIIVSTGMHNYEEILGNAWIDLADIIMHCISIYPCYLQEINIVTIQELLKATKGKGNEVGYSSHDFQGLGIPYAIYAGAKYIERHYTTDKTLKGSDHSTVSSDYQEMLDIIGLIEAAEKIRGDALRNCTDREIANRLTYRGF